MRKLLAMAVLGSVLCLYGCATTEAPAQKTASPKQFIKCATCGAEFTSQAGVEEHIKTHPGHVEADVKPLIRCATCGAEFTSQAGISDHIQANPGHQPAKIEGQFP
jgi:DNA-directed RNA polymerase subunit RPC12/RpoP